MAMACLVERAPCLPWRTCSISSSTNGPACVVGAFPSCLALRAFLSVVFSGMPHTACKKRSQFAAQKKRRGVEQLVCGRAVAPLLEAHLLGEAHVVLPRRAQLLRDAAVGQ